MLRTVSHAELVGAFSSLPVDVVKRGWVDGSTDADLVLCRFRGCRADGNVVSAALDRLPGTGRRPGRRLDAGGRSARCH